MALAVSLGSGAHAVRLVGVHTLLADVTKAISNSTDLWDPSNTVGVMGLDGHISQLSAEARLRKREAFVASVLGGAGL